MDDNQIFSGRPAVLEPECASCRVAGVKEDCALRDTECFQPPETRLDEHVPDAISPVRSRDREVMEMDTAGKIAPSAVTVTVNREIDSSTLAAAKVDAPAEGVEVGV